jgi:multidrug resistance efflux pump
MHQRGETINAGDSLITIADLHRTRIEAEVDEFDASRVRDGGEVSIAAEGYDARWKGVIEEVPGNVVSRRLKPQDPSKPIDTRVLLVKVAMTEATPLKLGQRVEVEFR